MAAENNIIIIVFVCDFVHFIIATQVPYFHNYTAHACLAKYDTKLAYWKITAFLYLFSTCHFCTVLFCCHENRGRVYCRRI